MLRSTSLSSTALKNHLSHVPQLQIHPYPTPFPLVSAAHLHRTHADPYLRPLGALAALPAGAFLPPPAAFFSGFASAFAGAGAAFPFGVAGRSLGPALAARGVTLRGGVAAPALGVGAFGCGGFGLMVRPLKRSR